MKVGLFLFLAVLCTHMFSYAELETPIEQQPLKNSEIFLNRTLEYAKRHATFKNLVFRNHEREFLSLAKHGQFPKTLFISCSDSRVIPEMIANSKPGELFVIRNAGNFVSKHNPDIAWDGVAATIEYAVEVLGVKDIIVCGHSECGAIRGLFSPQVATDPQFAILSRWLQFGQEAKETTNESLQTGATDAERYTVAEHVSVLYQLDNLLTYPFIKEKVASGKVFLHGWHFNIKTGEVGYYDPLLDQFLSLSNLYQK